MTEIISDNHVHDGVIERHLISHSEVEAFGQCEKKWSYAHLDQLEPVTQSAALGKGNAGHFLLEKFLKAIKAGADNTEARKEAINLLYEEDYDNAIMGGAITVAKPWMEHIFPTLGWKIVEVEKEFRLTIDEDLVYPFKIDALIEYRGELILVDHKFVWDPYDANTISLMPQMPRYIGAMRMMDIPVTRGVYNFLRTRNLKNPMEKYSQVSNPIDGGKMPEARIRHSMLEQVQEMRKIDAIEKMPESERPIMVRTVNKMNCAHCGFAELCSQELQTGKVAVKLREIGFRPNTYGYKELEA